MSLHENPNLKENKPIHSTMLQSSTVSQSRPSSLGDESQDYWYYCSHSYITDDQNKSRYEKEKKHDKKMDTLICNGYEMLREYCDPKLYANQQFPCDLFQNCRGIIFLRIWKAGLFVGGIGGTGIVMAHHNGIWSRPCAVSIGGIQLGLHVGVERVDDILILRDETALKLFMEKGHFKLGVDASVALGNFGRDTNTGITMSEGQTKSIYSYSFAKGAFIGLSLDGGMLTVDHSVNEEFYGSKIDAKDIFYGNAVGTHNNDFMKLSQLLNNCCQSKSINIQPNINPVHSMVDPTKGL
jgi:lipid-binding SYLF domain-containing protein